MTADFIVEDQSEQIALLRDPATYGLSAETVVREVDTHASAVFLAGDRVYKLKRAVRFSFMDFSDAEKRGAAAEAEVTLNRRTAPQLYLGVAAIIRQPEGELFLSAIGEAPADAVDWVVVMRRFDEDTLFDRQAEEHRLDDGKLVALAREISSFHGDAERIEGIDWPETAARIARDNITDMTGDSVLDAAAVQDLRALTEDELPAQGEALAHRSGSVRRCHGDLHLRNICEVDGRPTLFDCIEFNETFTAIDPLYDLAFLLMDLDYRGMADQAALVRDRYLEERLDYADHGAMPLYLSMRAAIRAKVTASGAAVQEDSGKADAMRAEASRYLGLACRYLGRTEPVLAAVGGFSGSGKSTLARAIAARIAPAPGAVVLRSDRIRKEIMGCAETERLPESAYASDVSVRVYALMEDRARALLSSGVSVIADATHTHPESRARLEDIAREADVPFAGLWLEAPDEELKARVSKRFGDASDADAAVVEKQIKAGAGEISWPTLQAGGSLASLADAALSRVHDVLNENRQGR